MVVVFHELTSTHATHVGLSNLRVDTFMQRSTLTLRHLMVNWSLQVHGIEYHLSLLGLNFWCVFLDTLFNLDFVSVNIKQNSHFRLLIRIVKFILVRKSGFLDDACFFETH